MSDTENIGPYYRNVGTLLLGLLAVIVIGLVGVLLLGKPLTDLAVKVLGALALCDLFGALLIIVRPKRFDDVFRMVIAALPFTKYTGNAVSEGAGKADL